MERMKALEEAQQVEAARAVAEARAETERERAERLRAEEALRAAFAEVVDSNNTEAAEALLAARAELQRIAAAAEEEVRSLAIPSIHAPPPAWKALVAKPLHTKGGEANVGAPHIGDSLASLGTARSGRSRPPTQQRLKGSRKRRLPRRSASKRSWRRSARGWRTS